MHHLLTFVLLAFACYRITRLAILDPIFDTPRDWLHAWLLNGNEPSRWRQRFHLVGPLIITTWLSAMLMLLLIAALGDPWMDASPDRWDYVIAAVVVLACAPFIGALSLIFTEGPTRLGMKLEEMIACPYCLSVWVGAWLELMTWTVRPIPLPLFYFLALSGASLMIYQYIDFQSDE